MNNKTRNQNQQGFTIVETLVGIAIFAMISLTLLNLFGVVLKNIRNNKAVLSANSLAAERMETLHSMDFENVKTDNGWIPTPGVTPIPSHEKVLRAGIAYDIYTDITWVDDPYDGSDPDDTYPYDYKRVRVRVQWTMSAGGGSGDIEMATNVVPDGMEGLSADKGGLYLTVFDSQGKAISNAEVYVDSAKTGYALTPAGGGRTDGNGNIWIPELTPSDDYHVRVTKSGFSTAETYAISAENPVPAKTDANVIAQRVTVLGFQIDYTGKLNIVTVHFDNPSNWQANKDSAAEQTEPALAAGTGGELFAAWTDTRGTDVHIYAQKLTAAGGVWGPAWANDAQVTDLVGASAPELAVTADGSLFAVWSASDGMGGTSIYLRQINTANGSLIGSEMRIGHAASGSLEANPEISSDQDGKLYIAWQDNRNTYWDIYAQKYDPVSAALWAEDKLVNTADAKDHTDPAIAIDRTTDAGGGNANNLFIVWAGNDTGTKDIYLRKFDKDGNPAFAQKMVNKTGTLDQYDPAIAWDGGDYLYVAWADERDSQPDIYIQKVDKDGIDNYGSDIKINDDSMATARRVNPTLTCSGGFVYAVWEDDRNGNTVTTVYSSKLNPSGVRQWTYDLVLGDTINSVQLNPALAGQADGSAVGVWQDDRGGTNDIKGVAYKEMGDFVRSGVPITVTSTKAKGETKDTPPIEIPKYQQTFSSDSGGNIRIGDDEAGLEWGGYTFTAGGGYSIVSVDLPSPIQIAPGGTSSAVINVEP